MEMYCRASNTGHVMRRDDRVPRTACAPATHWPGQVNGMRDEDEDEQSKKKKKKGSPLHLPQPPPGPSPRG